MTEAGAPDDGAAIIALDLASHPSLGDRVRAAIADPVAIGPAVAATAAHVERVIAAGGADADADAVAVAWAAVAALGWLAPVDELRAALAALPWQGTGALVPVRDRAEIELDVAAALHGGSFAVPPELGRLFAAHWLGDAAHAAPQGRAAVRVLCDGPYDMLDLFDELARQFPPIVERFEARLVAELPPERIDPTLVPPGFWLRQPGPAGAAVGLGGGGGLTLMMILLVQNDAPGWVLAMVSILIGGLTIVGTLAYVLWLAPREARYKVARLAVDHGLTAECIAAHLAIRDAGTQRNSAAVRILHREPGLRTLCAIAALAAATADTVPSPP